VFLNKSADYSRFVAGHGQHSIRYDIYN
jgi:hypothetical protein